MDKKKKAKTKTARESVAADRSSAAGKRSEQGSKAARNAPSKAPAGKQSAPTKSATPAANKGAGQKSKSTNGVAQRSQTAASTSVAKRAGEENVPSENRKRAVGKIMKTTDGFLGDKPHIRKTRRVAVVEQREDDGAVAIVRIFKKKGKRAEDPHAYVQELILLPENHSSLTEESIVEAKVILGVKTEQGKKPIFPEDLSKTEDSLTDKELKHIQDNVHNDTEQHRQTFLNKLLQWFKHFKT